MNMLSGSLKRQMEVALPVLLFASFAVLPAKAEEQHMALEVVAGKLKQNGSMDALRKADQAVAVLVARQPGFISRETGAGEGGEWFVIVHWASLKDAENAAKVFMQSEEGKASSSLLEPNGVLFKHYIKEQ